MTTKRAGRSDVSNGPDYVFSQPTDFTGAVVKYGLEARATTAKMAVPRSYFARRDGVLLVVTAL